MPRLPPSLLCRAKQIDPLLPPLLFACRDLDSARNELRWLKEFALDRALRTREKPLASDVTISREYMVLDSSPVVRPWVGRLQRQSQREQDAGWRTHLHDMVQQRSRGKPLQYILGTEYFGDLELKCREGVLIPRPDTAAAISYLSSHLGSATVANTAELRVLDLCTGTGCIPLLLQYELNRLRAHASRSNASHQIPLRTLGVDISPIALKLAQENKARLQREFSRDGRTSEHGRELRNLMTTTLSRTDFIRADILDAKAFLQLMKQRQQPRWDVLLCNPPYISPSSFTSVPDGTPKTARSVQKFEPKLALIPPPPCSPEASSTDGTSNLDPGDTFYPPLIQIASTVHAKIVWFEVADLQQASRVAALIRRASDAQDNVEIWREDPAASRSVQVKEAPWHDFDADSELERYNGIPVRGTGNGRSVIWWRGEEGREWSKATRT